MDSLQHICSRYDNPGNFHAPDSIWILRRGNQPIGPEMCIQSISLYLLCVVARMHNQEMNSRDHAKWIKISVVVLLDAAALSIGVFAIGEALIRMVTGIICLFVGFIVDTLGFTTLGPQLTIPLLHGLRTTACIFNAPYTAFLMTTQNSNVTTSGNQSRIFQTITCNACPDL